MTTESQSSQFINDFCSLFEQYSYGNLFYGRLCAHVLMGQTLKTCKLYFGPLYIDPRISCFIIQPSATGKSTPWGYVYAVGKEAGLVVEDIDEATDAALVGTEEPTETVDIETGAKVITHKKVSGIMETAEILHYDEGNFLIERKQQALNTLTWFQKALNPIGSEQSKCTKRLAHKTIEFYPTCSLIITSYPIDNIIAPVLNTGFFQRIVLYPKDIPIKERQGLEFLRVDKLGHRTFSEPQVKFLGERLQKIRAKYKDLPEVIFDESTKPVIKGNIEALYKLIQTAHPKVKEVMATFIPRYNNFMYTFAFHHSCDRMAEKVEIPDIKYAFSLSYILFNTLMSWIEETVDFYKIGSKDMTYLKQAYILFTRMEKDTTEGYVLKQKFLHVCSDSWRVSPPTVNRYIERFKDLGKVKEVEHMNKGLNIRYVKVEL